jgi:hypothetical protein
MKPLYIFDLDGTISLAHHRQPILDNKDDPYRWDKFFAACIGDAPNAPVITTLNMLLQSAEIWIWSGRSMTVCNETLQWLHAFTHWRRSSTHNINTLRMRTEKDYTPDDVLKARWHEEMDDTDKNRLIAVFEDRNRIVAMWRNKGITCFQVASGNF